MAKRIKPLGDGKWCWTENCSEHSYIPALLPPDEKLCASLQQGAKKLISELPNRQQLLQQGTPEQIQQAREAAVNAEYAKLHLAITPKGKNVLADRVKATQGDERKNFAALVNDSNALAGVYARNYQRFHYGSAYVASDGSEVRAIPVSLDNIMSVNDWVSESTRKFETIETPVEEPLAEDEVEKIDVEAPTKNKTKVFRKKNKLYYRDANGADNEIKTASYLIRTGKDTFTVKTATEFEEKYVSKMETEARKQTVLQKIERERFFPPTKLSNFIQM